MNFQNHLKLFKLGEHTEVEGGIFFGGSVRTCMELEMLSRSLRISCKLLVPKYNNYLK